MENCGIPGRRDGMLKETAELSAVTSGAYRIVDSELRCDATSPASQIIK
jgi:hypothetical protein